MDTQYTLKKITKIFGQMLRSYLLNFCDWDSICKISGAKVEE